MPHRLNMNTDIHIPETALSRIWEEHRFRPDSLTTTDGDGVQVIRRGRRNRDSGPDFVHALIRIGERLFEGDVELHLTLSDWQAHGHDTDPAYNHTVLHVVLWEPPQYTKSPHIVPICKANGESVPTLFVHSCLILPPEQLLLLFQHVDERKRQKIRQCQNTLNKISTEHILWALRQLGKKRLDERVQRFEQWFKACGSFEQVLYEAICEGLGYSSNKVPFRTLASRLPLKHIRSHLPHQSDRPGDQLIWLQAMLFGAAGLLPDLKGTPGTEALLCQQADPETGEYVTELRSLWEMLLPCLDLSPMSREEWHFFRLRPPNFPTRRLAALSYLIINYLVQPLFENYCRLFKLLASHPDHIAQIIDLLEGTLAIPAAGYWKGRYRYGPAVFPRHDRTFLGCDRVRDILISAVFPVLLLYARQNSQSDLESLILRLYEVFPSPGQNRVTQNVTEHVFARRKIPAKQLRTACMYQGMLHVYNHYCCLPACTQCIFGKRRLNSLEGRFARRE